MRDEGSEGRIHSGPMMEALLSALIKEGIDLEDPNFDSTFQDAMRAAIPAAADSLTNELRRTAPRMWCDWEALQWGFRKRLRSTWGKGYDRFHLLIVGCLELGDEFNRQVVPKAEHTKRHTLEALVRLHARSCQTAFEVQALIENGYANGAYARWRTLHEIAVTAVFIGQHGEDVAERYSLHEVIESLRAAKQYGQYYDQIGFEVPDPEEIRRLEVARDRLVERYGREFGGRYGWAAAALDKKSPHFSDIEESVKMDHYRPFYKMASHGVHAGPKGIRFNMGVVGGRTSELMIAGASNTGFTDPAHGSALSLIQTTAALVTAEPTFEHLTMLRALQKVADEVGAVFFEIQRKVENRVTGSLFSGWLWTLRTLMRRTLCRIRRAALR